MDVRARNRRTTLAVVAKVAGVSQATVSKVLNGHADVGAGTREHVARLLHEHGYVPRNRRPGTSADTIELVLDNMDNPYHLEIIRGVTEAGRQADVDVVVGYTPDARAGAQWVRRLMDRGRLGVIVVTSKVSAGQWRTFRAAGFPLVVIDPVQIPSNDVPSVGATNWVGGLDATEHLLSLGHRRIGVLGGVRSALHSRARLHGFHAAMETAEVAVDQALIRFGDFGAKLAFTHAGALLDLDDPPTAIFATSDLQAFGVIEAARVRGLRVPNDLSVVGFDDLSVAQWAAPPLTTVRQPLIPMARLACQTLLNLVAGRPPDSHHIELATELIIRDSTAAPRDTRR